MWTSTLQLDPAHVIPTRILGTFWQGAYFTSFAPLQVQNLPRQPLPASTWVRVRNSLAGICGSDLRMIFVDGDYSIAPAALPNHNYSYPGHEVVGEVIEVGEEVQSLRVGDRVVLQHGPNCLTAGINPPCRSCASGNYGLCESGTLPGPQSIGGGWSEEMLLHEQQLFRLPPGISNAQAVLLEPFAVAIHAVLRRLPMPGDHVLIIGAGTIGQLILQTVRALAPDAQVNVLARYAFQIERAAAMGARIIYPQDSYEGVQSATGAQLYQGRFGNKMLLGGYDVIYDTVGSKQTTHDALRWARAGSTVVMVGLSLYRMHIDLTPVWYQEVNLIGTLGHGRETWPIGTHEKKTTFEIAAELIESGRVHPDKLITHRYLLSEYRDALTTAKDKAHNRAIKVIFDFSKQPPSVVPNVRAASRRPQQAVTTGTESRLHEPLAPVEAPEQPPTPVPAASHPSAPFTPEQPAALATNPPEDDKTIVVSTSRHIHFTPPPQEESEPGTGHSQQSIDSVPQNTLAEEENITISDTSKVAPFDIAAQYGSLPGFHQDLEKLGITPRDTEVRDDIASVADPFPLDFTQPDVHTGPDNIEPPFFSPSTTEDYAWTQFIAPPESAETQSTAPAQTIEESAETQSTASAIPFQEDAEAPLPEPQSTAGEKKAPAPTTINQSNEENQLAVPTTPTEDNDDPKTITVPAAKRSRSKRKTDPNKAAPPEENQQFLPLTSENEGQPSALESGNQFTVTKDTPHALQDKGEPFAAQEQPPPTPQPKEDTK